jgi:hypothetical protein
MPRSAIALIVLAAVAAGCGGGSAVCGSAPCPSVPHHWTAAELARDLHSLPFPPHVDNRDLLYGIVCRITAGGTRAVCNGHRRFGVPRGKPVVARALLRVNGSWDLLCWPDPSEICDMAQIRAQRAHPITE